MPDIEPAADTPPNRRSLASVTLSDLGTARATREPSSRLVWPLWRFWSALLSRAAEIIDAELKIQELTVPHSHCPTCDEIHPDADRCASRAEGFCVSCRRRRMLYRLRCLKCGGSAVTDVTFRWRDEE